MFRPAWNELMTRVRPSDTIVVAWLDHFSRNFDEGMKIQAELTKQNIGIVAIKEGINTADDSAAAKLFRRMMLAQGAYQVEECQRMYAENPSIRRVARIIKVSQETVKRALEVDAEPRNERRELQAQAQSGERSIPGSRRSRRRIGRTVNAVSPYSRNVATLPDQLPPVIM